MRLGDVVRIDALLQYIARASWFTGRIIMGRKPAFYSMYLMKGNYLVGINTLFFHLFKSQSVVRCVGTSPCSRRLRAQHLMYVAALNACSIGYFRPLFSNGNVEGYSGVEGIKRHSAKPAHARNHSNYHLVY